MPTDAQHRAAPADVPLYLDERDKGALGARRGEPVTCGLPWPRGGLTEASHLVLTDGLGRLQPLQARALDRWPDGSVRWVLLDWLASPGGEETWRVRAEPSSAAPSSSGPLYAESGGGIVVVDTGAARFQMSVGGRFPFDAVEVGGRIATDPESSGLLVEDLNGRRYRPVLSRVEVEESGPVRVSVRASGVLRGEAAGDLAELFVLLHFFARSATVRFDLTVRNPRPARHPRGKWTLGQRGSIYLRELRFSISLPPAEGEARLACSPEPARPVAESSVPLELYQDSSGGERWDSRNHVNRRRRPAPRFRGYRLRDGERRRDGRRAEPIVTLERGGRFLGVAMRHFWQNFPKALEATDDSISLGLFPRQLADGHELQGGEQKTHEFHVAFDYDSVTDPPLAWCRSPLVAHAAPGWYSRSGAIPYLLPRSEDPNDLYLELVDSAIAGGDTFHAKREIIDEYGWRNFGDIYADHEAVFHPGPEPLISHYNNQYDAVAGLAIQFLRSGDRRWFDPLDELARHVTDIDVYHTDGDKYAFNHGLFWHTYHYVDADTSTHRSYPDLPGVGGGGPGPGHLYTSGLLLHHFLTGSQASRDTALELGRYVITADDGSRSIFRFLDRGPTGFPSESEAGFHGPGRAPGNSINALVDAHRLSGRSEFLDKAEELIRRCIHPADEIGAMDLLDAERRWFYVVFLQGLAKYLDHKADLGELDERYAYARASLLSYARWAAEHERPYLDTPEKLEYPTETWAAQDMRKSEVLRFAALHTRGGERDRFLERARYFFDSSTRQLRGFATRSLTRPVVLLLTNGYTQAYFDQHPGLAAPAPTQDLQEFGRPERFETQKTRAIRRLRRAAVALLVLSLLILGLRL